MRILMLIPVFALAACESMMQPVSATAPGAVVTPAAAGTPTQTLDPTPPPPPPAAAQTVAQFDTTTDADKAEALAVDTAAAVKDLGTTLATLGSPTEPGIWLKTPLVTSLVMGRVSYKGKNANVELRPSGGAAGSGSQISLAAMQTLGIPLTEIAEVSVSVE